MQIDVAATIGAATRTVRRAERDGAPVHVIEASRRFATDPDDLWDAVTNPERMPRWFLPLTGDLRPGGRFQLEGNAGGEILECERPHRLSVTWEFGGGVSWLDVYLSATADGGTLLRLEHAAAEDEHWRQFGPGAGGMGWDMALMGLGLHLAMGEALDTAAAMAWLGTPEGHDLLARSSDGWRAAAVEAGTPPDVADEAARRCLAAYKGEG